MQKDNATYSFYSTFFKRGNPLIGGYYVPVRNQWNWDIDYEHITEKDKKRYEKDFGTKIITRDEFLNWWCKLKQNNNNHN